MKLHFTIVILCFCSATATAQDMPLTQVLLPAEDWQLVGEGYKFSDAPASDPQGNLVFSDVGSGDIFKVDASGKVTRWVTAGERVSGMMFGPRGKLYACQPRAKQIAVYDEHGEFTVLASEVGCNDLAVGPKGDVYFTDTAGHRVWHIDPAGNKRVVDEGIEKPNGIVFWPDGRTLAVSDHGGKHVWAFRVEDDGSLKFKQPYYTVRTNPGTEVSKGDGMTVDSAGRLYVTTEVGLQMFDPTGRLGGVIRKPQDRPLTNVVFAGKKRDVMYVTNADKVYRRATKVQGVK